MISGIIAQGPAVPRGALAPSLYVDGGETVGTPFIDLAANVTRLLSASAVSDADVLYAPRRLQVLMAAFVADVDSVRVPRLVGAQLLHPLLYIAVDSFPLPAVALPGILQTHLHAADDAFFLPFIESHGSLRPGLFNAFDAVYAPAVAQAQTLRPNLYTAADIINTPAVRLNWIFARFLSDSDATFAPLRTGGATLATFNGIAQDATLSNSNRTATHTTTNPGGARSTTFKSAGKYYFEVTMTAVHGGWDTVGIALAIASYEPDMLSAPLNGVIYHRSGSLYTILGFDGHFLGAGSTTGDNIGVAADLNARKVWFRRNGGDWNGVSTESPITGAGGVAINGTPAPLAPIIAFGGSGTAVNDAMTANFGSSAYAYPRPSGFADWEA